MRYLTHPGSPSEPRQLTQWASAVQDRLIRLPAGADLMQGLTRTLTSAGFAQAGIVLIEGRLARVSFMTGRPDDSGYRVATHNGPWHREGPLTLLGGGAVLGLDENDAPLLHCHAYFADSTGAVAGGHMRPGECPLAGGGLTALACCPSDAGFKVAFDQETNFPIFHPLNHTRDADRS